MTIAEQLYQRGYEKGYKIGFEEGYKIGLEEGRRLVMMPDIAEAMLEHGIDSELVKHLLQ